MSGSEPIYLFCFARARDLPSAPEGTGLDRRSPLRLQSIGEITAVISIAPLEDFLGEGAEARMQDVEWLMPRALWHERVIEEVFRSCPVFPARLATLFSSPEKLRDLMARHHDRILAFLDHVAGQDEWAVKGYLDRPKALSARRLAALEQAPLSASPGTRYMQEQRIRAQAEGDLRRWLDATRARVRGALAGYANDVVDRKVIPVESAELPGQMVANWAFLVPRRSVDELRARVRVLDAEYQPAGLRLQDSGAWPPYSFTPALVDPEGAGTGTSELLPR